LGGQVGGVPDRAQDAALLHRAVVVGLAPGGGVGGLHVLVAPEGGIWFSRRRRAMSVAMTIPTPPGQGVNETVFSPRPLPFSFWLALDGAMRSDGRVSRVPVDGVPGQVEVCVEDPHGRSSGRVGVGIVRAYAGERGRQQGSSPT